MRWEGSPYRISSASQSGSATASLLRRAIHSPRAFSNARLFALQKPLLYGSNMVCALGRRSAHEIMDSRLPSVEPLSNTMNSVCWHVCLASELKHASTRVSPFQLTTMTLISESPDMVFEC